MKNCDICNKFTPQNNAYLFDTATVLASDRYIDFMIDILVKQGKLPSSVISKGINKVARNIVRDDLKQLYGTLKNFESDCRAIPRYFVVPYIR